MTVSGLTMTTAVRQSFQKTRNSHAQEPTVCLHEPQPPWSRPVKHLQLVA
jgi:hypothetical protein